MSRKPLSEFRAKKLIYSAIGQQYTGVEIDAEQLDWWERVDELDPNGAFVVKVDQAEGSRFKHGLVKLDRKRADVADDAREIFGKGYRYVLVEEYKPHEQADERYLTIERTREGNRVSYSSFGGVDVEAHAQSVSSRLYDGHEIEDAGMPAQALDQIVRAFDDNYMSFLEINPFTVGRAGVEILDAAVEVDDEAGFFQHGWTGADLRSPKTGSVSPEELAVKELGENSQASFALERINADGSIWLLLSGGGASVVVADEVDNVGFGSRLGNYGEYSGGPNTEETRHYTEQVIRLMLRSNARTKVLIIGGGVANFTDVGKTFKGVIEALDNHLEEIQRQRCKVFVRRGGPHQEAGLSLMREYLEAAGLLGVVSGPDMVLSEIVDQAVEQVVA